MEKNDYQEVTDTVPVSAMLPAHQRVEKTLCTIRRLQACKPAPDEILVHVAEAQGEMLGALEVFGSSIHVLTSRENLGPGGARNRMIQAAKNEIVASFDDDSYPHDEDFFAGLLDCFARLEDASILALNIFEGDAPVPDTSGEPVWVGGFVGCGCAYRRSHFIEDEGYVPIPVAYSMEEADLTIRYLARGRKVYYVPDLRVYHDTVLSHHASPEVAAMQVANTGLFAWLRYPPEKWMLGVGQVIHKWLDTLKRHRWLGGLWSFPLAVRQMWRYRKYRQTVPAPVLEKYLLLRRKGLKLDK